MWITREPKRKEIKSFPLFWHRVQRGQVSQDRVSYRGSFSVHFCENIIHLIYLMLWKLKRNVGCTFTCTERECQINRALRPPTRHTPCEQVRVPPLFNSMRVRRSTAILTATKKVGRYQKMLICGVQSKNSFLNIVYQHQLLIVTKDSESHTLCRKITNFVRK